MGDFYRLLKFQRALLKRHNCLSLQDWFVDSVTIATGSVNQAFQGRDYYPSICEHEDGFDALVQRRIEDITNEFELIHPDLLCNISMQIEKVLMFINKTFLK